MMNNYPVPKNWPGGCFWVSFTQFCSSCDDDIDDDYWDDVDDGAY